MSDVAVAMVWLLVCLAGVALWAGLTLCLIASDSDRDLHDLHEDQSRGPEWPRDR